MHKIGDKVICITPSKNELTEYKEYEVIEIIKELHQVKVLNDRGEEKGYIWIRFEGVGG